MATWWKHCCTPVFAEMLAPRGVALAIAAIGGAQLGASCLGFGLPCGFHSATGLPCPGCGLTRSVLALLHGHVKDSILLHPFGPLLAVGMATALVSAVLPQRPRQRLLAVVAGVERHTGATVWLLMLLMILWAVRLTGVLPLATV